MIIETITAVTVIEKGLQVSQPTVVGSRLTLFSTPTASQDTEIVRASNSVFSNR